MGVAVPAGAMANSGYADANPDRQSWFLAQGRKIEKNFKAQIERSIEEAFEENVFGFFANSLAEGFADHLVSGLGGMFSIGPLIEMSATFNLSLGAGESRILRQIEVMTRILLESIELSKDEIIASVDQHFQDETRARLNSIIRDLSIYNARSEANRSADYRLLGDLISHANYVLERIEVRPGNVHDGLHNYMSLVGVQVIMQREYTRWLYLNETDPNAGEDVIDEETASVLGAQLSPVNNFLVNSEVGSVSAWKDLFHEEFYGAKDDIEYVGGVSAERINSFTGQQYNPNLSDFSGRYTYPIGEDRRVEFMVVASHVSVQSSGPGDSFLKSINYDAYGPAGNYTGSFQDVRVTDGSLIPYPPTESVVRESIAADVVQAHKESDEAFAGFMLDGYMPVKRMMDTWWGLTNRPPRMLSEVDNELDQVLSAYSDIVVNIQPYQEYMMDGDYLVTLSNIGGATATQVGFDIDYSGYIALIEGRNGAEVYCDSSYYCTVGDIQPGEEVRLFVVLFYDGAHRPLSVDALTSSQELRTGNNGFSMVVPSTD
ncbi:MAG: hypothetical protein LAT61_15800 [Alcanivorax sp.]|nr:hypothetical protein [Alcanivorax sp.]